MRLRGPLAALLVLNLGLALWWWQRPVGPLAPVAARVPASATPTLVLVDEAGLPPPGLVDPEAVVEVPEEAGDLPADEAGSGGTASPADASAAAADTAPVPAPAPAPAPPAPPAPAACARLAGLSDEAAMAALRRRLGGLVQAHREQWMQAAGTSAWRVMIPPLGSRQEAEQMARRIAAAGFTDYFIIRQGELANAVALGQFRQQQGASRHRDALVAAGFPAVMSAAGSPVRQGALLVRLAPGTGLPKLRARAGAGVTVDSIDCAQVR